MISFAQAELERDRRISDHLVRLVQIIFALVLAQSLFYYKDVIVDPLSTRNRIATVALVSVFLMTVLSWIDWHVTMELHPYDRRALVEWVRLAADLMVVVLYAYLLFAIEPLRSTPAGDISGFLLGFPIVFALYLASGLARKARYGVAASRSFPIVLFLFFFCALWLSYRFIPAWHTRSGNLVFAGFSASGVVGYRWFRSWWRRHVKERKQRGGRIGVDIDGVLADQVGQVLPLINEQFNLSLDREDVADWRLPLPTGSDIAVEIEKALKNSDCVLGMSRLPGARQFLNRIYPKHEIVIITARPPEALGWTRVWLEGTVSRMTTYT